VSTFREQFGRELESRRRRKGLSVSATAREANRLAGEDGPSFHVTVIQRWERGESLPSIEQALWICRVLGIPLLALTLPREEGPWLDGSLETLENLDDQIRGTHVVEEIDLGTGLRTMHRVQHDDLATLDELPEIPEEVR
jgi:transcriptional regulator with XRE-family HTH domain